MSDEKRTIEERSIKDAAVFADVSKGLVAPHTEEPRLVLDNQESTDEPIDEASEEDDKGKDADADADDQDHSNTDTGTATPDADTEDLNDQDESQEPKDLSGNDAERKENDTNTESPTEDNNPVTDEPPSTTNSTNVNTKRTLVVYSGPTSANQTLINTVAIHQLYKKNFEYFLKEGIECDAQDTVLVVTKEVYPTYAKRVEEMDKECQKQGHRIVLYARENNCWDMESAWVVFSDQVPGIQTDQYDAFVYVNCGMTGPPTREERHGIPWTQNFTSLLNDKVAMSGLTHNCYAWAHIQSFMYALSLEGLRATLKDGAIYDCRKSAAGPKGPNAQKSEIISRYEMGMSRSVMKRGFAIQTTIRPRIFLEEDWSWCGRNHTDLWAETALVKEFGAIPNITETMFFKSSRLMPDDVRQRLGFVGRAPANWK